MSKISKTIKKQRVLNKMTQEDLAAKIHVTRQTVSSWETDRTQPDLEILLSLADAFGIEVEGEYLIEDGEITITYSLLGLRYDWVKSFEKDGSSIFIDGTEFVKEK
jgi:transcriptional regulator with XRE-family HTH domain